LPNPITRHKQSAYPFTANPGDKFTGWDASTNLDWMQIKVYSSNRIVHRESNVPYFAGPGGVTSPTGYTWTPLPPDWRPDLVKAGIKNNFALLARF